jgi:hypothetical protein
MSQMKGDRTSDVTATLPQVSAPATVRMRVALVLSGVSLALMITATVAGLLVEDLYRDPSSTASMLRAYDLVTLVVVAPGLGMGIVGSRRGSTRAMVLWLGMLAATVYTYAYYLFEAALGDLFLLHVALFSSALFALILGLSAVDVESIAKRFTPKTPRRWIGGFLALLAASLGGIWIYAAVQFALTARMPAGSALVETDSLVRLGMALDLSVLVPGYALAAVLIWRRNGWGYVLAAVLLTSGVVHQIGYMVALPFQVAADVPGATAVDPVEPVIAAGFLLAAVALLASVRGPDHLHSGSSGIRRP